VGMFFLCARYPSRTERVRQTVGNSVHRACIADQECGIAKFGFPKFGNPAFGFLTFRKSGTEFWVWDVHLEDGEGEQDRRQLSKSVLMQRQLAQT